MLLHIWHFPQLPPFIQKRGAFLHYPMPAALAGSTTSQWLCLWKCSIQLYCYHILDFLKRLCKSLPLSPLPKVAHKVLLPHKQVHQASKGSRSWVKDKKKHIKNTSPGLTVHTVPICCLGWNGNGNLQSWVVGQTLELGWRHLHRKQHLPCPRSSFSEDFVGVTLHTAAPIAEHTFTTILLVPKGSLQES